MITGFIVDTWFTMVNVFGSFTTINGIVAIAIVLICGLQMKKMRSIITYTSGALAVYVLLGYLTSVGNGTPYNIAMQNLWDQTTVVTLRTFLTHFISFSLLVGSIFLVKSGIEKGF